MTEQKITCIERVSHDAWTSGHCSRKPGFGPSGMYCRQHAEKREISEPTLTWYRTSKWSFEIDEIAVISVSDKTILIKDEHSTKPSRAKINSEFYDYWLNRSDAVDFLRKRLDAKRTRLADDEAAFEKATRQ